MKKDVKYYVYEQNNTNGYFEGPHFLIVVARNSKEANEKAKEKGGVYFDGVEKGIDCPCCGDRWRRLNDDSDYVVGTLDEALDIVKRAIKRYIELRLDSKYDVRIVM